MASPADQSRHDTMLGELNALREEVRRLKSTNAAWNGYGQYAVLQLEIVRAGLYALLDEPLSPQSISPTSYVGNKDVLCSPVRGNKGERKSINVQALPPIADVLATVDPCTLRQDLASPTSSASQQKRLEAKLVRLREARRRRLATAASMECVAAAEQPTSGAGESHPAHLR